MPVHKSKAITYITPAAREAAEKEQTLVLQGRGKLWKKYEGLSKTLGSK